jgi:hypothetical protein
LEPDAEPGLVFCSPCAAQTRPVFSQPHSSHGERNFARLRPGR